MSRVQKIGNAGMTVLTVLAIVVVQGILAYRFRVFRYFDLPLIYCVYYGFRMSKPVAIMCRENHDDAIERSMT